MAMRKPIHLTGKDLAGMVQLRPQDIGEYVVIPGTPDRLEAAAKKIKNSVFMI